MKPASLEKTLAPTYLPELGEIDTFTDLEVLRWMAEQYWDLKLQIASAWEAGYSAGQEDGYAEARQEYTD